MESHDDMAARIIEFLQRRVRRRGGPPIGEQTPLVSSGLIDSFALVEVLSELEKVTGRRIPAGRVAPEDLDTVARMLETAERVGRPRDS